MANKNQKQIRAIARKEGTTTINVPAHGYHNNPAGNFTPRPFSVNKPDGDGVVSRNVGRNMQMRILTNTDASGKKFSVTKHEIIDGKKNSKPYKRKAAINVGGVRIETGASK